MEFLKAEVEATMQLNHTHIVKYHEFRENRTYKKKDGSTKQVSYIVQELVEGGELYGYIANSGFFSEKMCRHFFKQMLKAVHYMHERGIAHRDLKPENILLDAKFDIKLIDFGFASPLEGRDNSGYMLTQLGTPIFMAPELIEGRKYQGVTVDLFALGVILFSMRAGHSPFDNIASKDDMQYKYIINHRFDIFWKSMHQIHKPGHFSEDFMHLINCMLDYHPSKRLLMADIIGHPWLSGELPHDNEV